MQKDSAYCIAFRSIKNQRPLYQGDVSSAEFKLILPSVRYWYADPFVVTINGVDHIFAEQYDRVKKIGRIAVVKINAGKITKPKTIIKESFHLSFPNVFCVNGKYYMIPESVASNQIRVYKMGQNVYEWELCNAYSIPNLVDTAVWVNDDVYLLSCEEKKGDVLQDKLRLFKINNFPDGSIVDKTELLSEKGYSYENRNGGNIIPSGERIYRVGQNSLPDFYGKSISLYSIQFYDSRICFKNIKTINSEDIVFQNNKKNHVVIRGVHTYNINENYEVIDTNCDYYSIQNILLKIIKRMNVARSTLLERKKGRKK